MRRGNVQKLTHLTQLAFSPCKQIKSKRFTFKTYGSQLTFLVLEIGNSSASSKTQKNYTRFLSLDSEGKENRFPKNLPTDTAGQQRRTVTEK